MNRKLLLPTVGLSLLASIAPSFAGMLVLEGNVTKPRVDALNSEIQWNTSLAQAQSEARRTGKMIFWVHMLGSMSGAT